MKLIKENPTKKIGRLDNGYEEAYAALVSTPNVWFAYKDIEPRIATSLKRALSLSDIGEDVIVQIKKAGSGDDKLKDLYVIRKS